MKKTLSILFILAFTFSLNAYAVSRNNTKVPTSTVLVGGGETIQSFSKNLGHSDGDAGGAVQLSSTSIPCSDVTVCASADNRNVVYVGGSNIEANWRTGARIGVPLGTGTSVDRCVTFKVDDVNKVYGVAYATADQVIVTYTEF